MATRYCVLDPTWPPEYALKAELLANQLRHNICGFPAHSGKPCTMRPKKGYDRCTYHKDKEYPRGDKDPAKLPGNLLTGSKDIAKSTTVFDLRSAIGTAKWLLQREEEEYQNFYRMRAEMTSPSVEPERKVRIRRQLFFLLAQTNQEKVNKLIKDDGPTEEINDIYIGFLYGRLEELRRTLEHQTSNLATITKRAAETENLTRDLIARKDADIVLKGVARGYAEAIRDYLPPEKAEELLKLIEKSISKQLQPLLDREVVHEGTPLKRKAVEKRLKNGAKKRKRKKVSTGKKVRKKTAKKDKSKQIPQNSSSEQDDKK